MVVVEVIGPLQLRCCTHNVAAVPIQEIEVVIVHKVWCIKDALLALGDMPKLLLAWCLPHILCVQALQVAVMALRRCWCFLLERQNAS